ncbi:hypothetical protein F5J12DRAFT_786865 [Pisolithus orientalis]|uniref:uncharacterized protein n=1 Tax=Pisolithus orientalis TaxID=936130 RepID=UPI002224C256|nr:uncharacterized protein F5J12DRAFT_786865 [Pisolithus orientalis]KAI5988469.1 hypothetical protein F5J12DRAFT_786865 [Pisolithus orientalis]
MAPCTAKEKQRMLLPTTVTWPTDSHATEVENAEGQSAENNQLYTVKGGPAMISTAAAEPTTSSSTSKERTQDDSNEIDELISMLKTNTLAFYGTRVQLTSHVEFFQGGFSGNITVMKDSGNEMMELLISGIFQVDCQNFFMGPKGAYMPSGAFNCQLIAVQKDAAFKTACTDFPAIVGNVRALEKLIPSKKGTTLASCICEANSVTSIQVSHSLFMKKDKNVDPDTASVEAMTHMVCLLPAVDQNHAAIAPSDYLRKDKKSVFSGMLCEMVVLCEPPPPPMNPLKRSVYGGGPSFSHMPTTKKLCQT